MDATGRIAALENPELDWPLAGSFAEMRQEGVVASLDPDVINIEFDVDDDANVAG